MKPLFVCCYLPFYGVSGAGSKAPGIMFGIYMILAGVERFLIELIRVNTRYNVAGISFTQAELISIGMVVGGAVLIGVGLNNQKKAIAR